MADWKGKNNPMFGIRKFGSANPMYGKLPWNKGMTGIYSGEVKAKMSKSRKEWLKHNKHNRLGIKHTSDAKLKMGMKKIGKKLSDEHKKRLSEAYSGERNRFWAGGVSANGKYVLIYQKGHPRAKANYVPQHVLVMESSIGRYLTKEEIVHHKDSNPKNNSIDNLMLFANKSEHAKYHGKLRFNKKNNEAKEERQDGKDIDKGKPC